jgi:transcriptional regulator with XRE-family HTH domain
VLCGLSQAELAERAGVAQSALYRYETEQTSPRLKTIAAIVTALTDLGIEFLPETEDRGMGIVLRKR